jgi:hypothetical protein
MAAMMRWCNNFDCRVLKYRANTGDDKSCPACGKIGSIVPEHL